EAVAGLRELQSEDHSVVRAHANPWPDAPVASPVALGVARRVLGRSVGARALLRTRPLHHLVLPARIVEAGVAARRVVEEVVAFAAHDADLHTGAPRPLGDDAVVAALQEDPDLAGDAGVVPPAEVGPSRRRERDLDAAVFLPQDLQRIRSV